jgi:Holliday junction resolvase
MELEKISKAIKNGKELEEVLEKFGWKDFEKVISEIFERNDFSVLTNFRFKTRKRYEIDLIGIRGNLILCADCKSWSSRKSKKVKLEKLHKNKKRELKN